MILATLLSVLAFQSRTSSHSLQIGAKTDDSKFKISGSAIASEAADYVEVTWDGTLNLRWLRAPHSLVKSFKLKHAANIILAENLEHQQLLVAFRHGAVLVNISGKQRSYWVKGDVVAGDFDPTSRRVLLVTSDNAAHVFSGSGEQRIVKTLVADGLVRAVRFTPGGRYVISASGKGEITLSSLTDKSFRRILVKDPLADFEGLVVDPVGGRLVAEKRIEGGIILNLRSGKVTAGLKGNLLGGSFSRDGKQFIAGSFQGVNVFDSNTGVVLHRYGRAIGIVNDPQFSADDVFVVATSGGGEVHVWPVAQLFKGAPSR